MSVTGLQQLHQSANVKTWAAHWPRVLSLLGSADSAHLILNSVKLYFCHKLTVFHHFPCNILNASKPSLIVICWQDWNDTNRLSPKGRWFCKIVAVRVSIWHCLCCTVLVARTSGTAPLTMLAVLYFLLQYLRALHLPESKYVAVLVPYLWQCKFWNVLVFGAD